MSKTSEHVVLPYGRQVVDLEDVEGVSAVVRSPFLTTGPQVEQFEFQICRITGAKYAVACSSGTAALHLACMAIGVRAGHKGVTSPISFLSSANCIEYCAGSTDFVDIDPESLCLSVDALAEYCESNGSPDVVIPVDFAGIPADLPAIKALSETYGFKVIEDAAHAMGSVYRCDGQSYFCGACVHSDLAIFSFHPVKAITTGEGGAVTTNDEQLALRLRQLRTHGMNRSEVLQKEKGAWYYEMVSPGYNYKITDLQCALGMTQIEKLVDFKLRRQELVSLYNIAFEDDWRILIPPQELTDRACPHLYPIRFRAGETVRRAIYDSLKTENIYCQVHYIPVYWQPYYAKKYGYAHGKCPNAETYYSQCLSLPLFPSMTNDDVFRVVKAVFDCLKQME